MVIAGDRKEVSVPDFKPEPMHCEAKEVCFSVASVS